MSWVSRLRFKYDSEVSLLCAFHGFGSFLAAEHVHEKRAHMALAVERRGGIQRFSPDKYASMRIRRRQRALSWKGCAVLNSLHLGFPWWISWHHELQAGKDRTLTD